MVEMNPLQPPQPPLKFRIFNYVELGHADEYTNLKTDSYFLKYFNGDWRLGQEVHKFVITQRLYQISPNSTQA